MTEKPASGASRWTDPDEAPELDDTFFDRATYEVAGTVVTPPRKTGRPRSESPKVRTGLRLDADVLAYFKSQGDGWQTKINAVLREVMTQRR